MLCYQASDTLHRRSEGSPIHRSFGILCKEQYYIIYTVPQCHAPHSAIGPSIDGVNEEYLQRRDAQVAYVQHQRNVR